MFDSKSSNCKKVELLYNKYKFFMYNQAYSILNDNYLAEDAVHQSFIKIIRNISKIEEIDSVKTKNFLAVICRNVAIDLYNEKKKKFVSIENIEILEDRRLEFPNEIIISNENVRRIKKAINSLPIIYKDVLILERLYGYTEKEVAKLLDISVEAAYKRSIRARKILLKILERDENGKSEK